MTIVLTYTKEDGTQKQFKSKEDAIEINLASRSIVNIDLTPLTSCANLEELDLSENLLQSIDTSPLVSCASLRKINLSNNRLLSIDLVPLRNCTNLSILNLRNNNLRIIDLSPLAGCNYMTRANLARNPLQMADVTFFANNSRFRIRYDDGPLSSWLKRDNAMYQRPFGIYPWSFLYQIAQRFGSRRIQQDILHALGLERYGFIDKDLRDAFLSIPPDTPNDEAIRILKKELVDAIELSVYNGGSTVGLKLDELLDCHGEIAVRAARIIEMRKREMELVELVKTETRIYLNELWLTAYGYEVLSSLNVGLTIEPTEFERIQQAFKSVGLKIKTGVTPIASVKMSEELKRCIFWIVGNKGRPWSEIVKQEK